MAIVQAREMEAATPLAGPDAGASTAPPEPGLVHVRNSAADAFLAGGSAAVKRFYDDVGWKQSASGRAEDTNLFGVKQDGPIRQELHRLRLQRVIDALELETRPMSLVECGCGGNPAVYLAKRSAQYTGVDFSHTGLELARQRLNEAGLSSAQLVQSELGALPFEDQTFDAAYSAHAIYHIPTAEGQRNAFREIMRVLKPGGRAALVLANPRPLLFPARALRRVLADTPGLSHALNRMRPPPPLPFKPMSIGWMRRELSRYGQVRVGGYAIASVWFDQHVSETSRSGRAAWKTFGRLENRWFNTAARLGNFVLITVRKR
jgi:ubiquinone/menaquinone biosynthesis C-methylase UbiE